MACILRRFEHANPVSVSEIKREIQSLSEEDRIYLAAWIKHLSRVDDPAYQKEVGRRIDTAREGRSVS